MRSVTNAKDYILTALLLVLAASLLVVRHDGGLQNARKVSVTMLSVLEKPLSNIRVYRQALSTNTYLQRQNVLLQDELSRLRSAEEQNRVLRDLLSFRQESEHELLPVQIAAKDLVGLNNSLTINRGSNDGVKTGMPVRDTNGLIGTVILVNPNYAQVLPYSNSVFRVSARVQETRAYGIVSWQASGSRALVMNHVPQTIEVEPGQIVETSGHSNQYPPGIPIGVITRTVPGDGVDTQTVYLDAFADLHILSEAFVVLFTPDSEISNLQARQEDLF
ncbi:MAG: rod shape-determining protein MreC [Balneolaceae bacterium]